MSKMGDPNALIKPLTDFTGETLRSGGNYFYQWDGVGQEYRVVHDLCEKSQYNQKTGVQNAGGNGFVR